MAVAGGSDLLIEGIRNTLQEQLRDNKVSIHSRAKKSHYRNNLKDLRRSYINARYDFTKVIYAIIENPCAARVQRVREDPKERYILEGDFDQDVGHTVGNPTVRAASQRIQITVSQNTFGNPPYLIISLKALFPRDSRSIYVRCHDYIFPMIYISGNLLKP